MDLHAYTKSISELFSVDKKYIVPRFQREYSWKKEEVAELWQDIVSNINVNEGRCNNTEYFIGALVLVGASNSFEMQIVDGQQRLTTITIILSALTQTYKDINQENLALAIYNRYIEGKDDQNNQYFKLVNETPKPFFQRRIQYIDKETRVAESEEETKLAESYNLFYDRLKLSYVKSNYRSFNDISGDDEEKYIIFLTAIRDQLLSHLKVIYITVADEDDAYTIFETLNARGMSLSAVDLVKNVIFKELSQQHPDDYAKTQWKEIRNILSSGQETVQIDMFFRHFWLSKYGFTSEGRIYKSFKKHMSNGVLECNSFLTLLQENSKYYTSFVNPQESDWPQQEEKSIFRSLQALSLFKVVQPRPLLLALSRARANNKINITDHIEILLVLENFHFIFTAICSSRASGIDGKYSKAARDLEECTTIVKARKVLSDLKVDLIGKIPSKVEFQNNIAKLWFTNRKTKDKKLIQYIFRKIEKYSRQTQELTTDFITLEHIIPQSEASASAYVGLLGNLLPLDQKINQVVDTSPFAEKITHFNNSELTIVNQFVAEYGTLANWTESKIRSRTQKISNQAYDDVWKI
ncbi:DUF262 domain-containing protein [Methanococcoides sp. SA1]|nr:DUF262 domain-containing protein [Methanococcoides sp. SA1]